MRVPLLLATAALALPAVADEGMWTFDAFPSEAVERAYGFRPDAGWLEQVRLATARFPGGCSGSFVSGGGLVMTNHHCILRCLSDLSDGERDLFRDGFLARAAGDELRCPALEVDQLLSTADVTERVERAAKGLEGRAHADAVQAESSRLERECQTSPSLRCEVVSLFHGGRHHLYTYRRWQDVRLVFAPEQAAANFGGDPDNFDFPRFALDAAFVRAYQGGKPARTPHHFGWAGRGAADGELTFVPGNPGKTSRLLTVAQLLYHRDVYLPESIADLAELQGMAAEFARRGPSPARQIYSTLRFVSNSLKALRGRHEALRDPAFLAARQAAEERLRSAIGADPARGERALPAFDAIARARAAALSERLALRYLESAPALTGRAGLDERTHVSPGDLVSFARALVRGAAERPKADGDRLAEYGEAALPALAEQILAPRPVHPEKEALLLAHWLGRVRSALGPDHPSVRQLLGQESPDELAARVVSGSKLGDPAVRRALWDGGAAAVAASADPAVAFARTVDAVGRAARARWQERVLGPERKAEAVLAQARLEALGTSGYPDATFTPRLSYGRVRGFEKGGAQVGPFSFLGGAFERHTGRPPFALPPSLLAARDRLDLRVPYVFTTTNDIIGGNSGSAVVSRRREVLGLVFDGNLPSLGGDYAFDEAGGNRCLAVNAGAILELLRKAYGADRLAGEIQPASRAAR